MTKVPCAATPAEISIGAMGTFPRTSPFLKIKDGTDFPPIVIAHGLSGTVQVSELAQHIETQHPIFGVQAKGVDGREEPFDRVEDMADFYLSVLDDIQSQDPYVLIGYSFGGLVALEMAQRLLKSGKRVALLVMLDAFPHPRFMPLPWRVRLFGKRMLIHGEHMRQMSFVGAADYFTKGIKRRLHLARPLGDSEGLPEMSRLNLQEAALRRVNEKAYHAYANYQPRYYPAKINFVTTQDKTFFPGDPSSIWADLSAELEVEVIPGNHLNIVTTEFHALAAVLTRYIQSINPSSIEVATRPFR